jgi:hypothetical protein
MPGSEEFIQTAVHALEAGGFAFWMKCGVTLGGICVVLHFYQFRGLSTPVAMYDREHQPSTLAQ